MKGNLYIKTGLPNIKEGGMMGLFGFGKKKREVHDATPAPKSHDEVPDPFSKKHSDVHVPPPPPPPGKPPSVKDNKDKGVPVPPPPLDGVASQSFKQSTGNETGDELRLPELDDMPDAKTDFVSQTASVKKSVKNEKSVKNNNGTSNDELELPSFDVPDLEQLQQSPSDFLDDSQDLPKLPDELPVFDQVSDDNSDNFAEIPFTDESVDESAEHTNRQKRNEIETIRPATSQRQNEQSQMNSGMTLSGDELVAGGDGKIQVDTKTGDKFFMVEDFHAFANHLFDVDEELEEGARLMKEDKDLYKQGEKLFSQLYNDMVHVKKDLVTIQKILFED